MSYMRSTDSAVLAEFGRIMQEKEQLKKVAQASPLAALLGHQVGGKEWNDTKAKLLAANPANKEPIEAAEAAFRSGAGKDVLTKLIQEPGKYGWDAMEGLVAKQPQAPQMANQPAPGTPVAAAPPARAALSAREKTADGKAYDVTGKEDMVNEAHPGKAMVEGELVENLNQQQDADKSVAEKSAKNVLVALYKLAKRLKAENNEKAYALVKETFLDLSKSLKK